LPYRLDGSFLLDGGGTTREGNGPLVFLRGNFLTVQKTGENCIATALSFKGRLVRVVEVRIG
jgi:hypothetical protein